MNTPFKMLYESFNLQLVNLVMNQNFFSDTVNDRLSALGVYFKKQKHLGGLLVQNGRLIAPGPL